MKPLQGKHILVTRGKSQARSFIEKIEEEGGVSYHTPLLAFQLNDSESHQEVLHQLHDYSWVFLTSSNGVKFFFELLTKHHVRLPAKLRFAIIGTKTNRALQSYGYQADFIPSRFQATTMEKEFFAEYPQPGNILYIRGNRSRDVLPVAFRSRGVFFQSMTVYDTLLVKAQGEEIRTWLKERKLDALTFTSPSTVSAFVSIVHGSDFNGKDLPCFCIGPTTAETARRCGFRHVFVPKQYTINEIMNQLIHYFSNEGKR